MYLLEVQQPCSRWAFEIDFYVKLLCNVYVNLVHNTGYYICLSYFLRVQTMFSFCFVRKFVFPIYIVVFPFKSSWTRIFNEVMKRNQFFIEIFSFMHCILLRKLQTFYHNKLGAMTLFSKFCTIFTWRWRRRKGARWLGRKCIELVQNSSIDILPYTVIPLFIRKDFQTMYD